jgi:predicted DNA-binding transcriptional regulator AlpA
MFVMPKPQANSEQRYVREKEAAAFLGVSVSTLQGWRSRGEPCSPPFSKVGGMVMYSMKALEEYMEMRTITRR